MDSCYKCEYYDREHDDAYGEAICKEADEIIRLKKGQHCPEWCPKKDNVNIGMVTNFRLLGDL